MTSVAPKDANVCNCVDASWRLHKTTSRTVKNPGPPEEELAAQPEALDERTVALDVDFLEVAQKATALTNQKQ